jgi:hypothetical protein
MRRRLTWALSLLSVLVLACEGSGDESKADVGESGETSGNIVTNGCGTYDLSEPGDSEIPQDPDHPDIIAACTSLCEAMAEIDGCGTDVEGCVNVCKQRSCSVCSGTLAPLVNCEAEQIDPSVCSCVAGAVECPETDACDEVEAKTYQCGG